MEARSRGGDRRGARRLAQAKTGGVRRRHPPLQGPLFGRGARRPEAPRRGDAVAGQGDRRRRSRRACQLATMQKLARYWATDYDWRKCEAKLNALPNFVTEIDGLDIHFIHVRSKHPNALPIIITHGWPGSIIEQLKIIDPLTNPTAHGGTAADAFDVVIPSLPGYGLLRPTRRRPAGTPIRIATRVGDADEAPRLHEVRRAGRRLGQRRLGDHGSPAARRSCSASTPTWRPPCRPRSSRPLASNEPPPADLSADERKACDSWTTSTRTAWATPTRWRLRPQTLYGIADSPVGLAAWMIDHDIRSYGAHRPRLRRKVRGADAGRHPRQRHALLADEHGDLVGPPLLGHEPAPAREASSTSEGRPDPRRGERVRATRSTRPRRAGRRRRIPSSSITAGTSKGSHFAAWEQPTLLVADLRASFKSLR